MAGSLTVFAAILGVVLGAYWVFVVRLEDQEDRTLRKRLRVGTRVLGPSLVRPPDKLSSVRQLDSALAFWHVGVGPLQRLIVQSGLNVTVGTVFLASVFAALVGLFVVGRIASSTVFGLVGAALAAPLPILYLKRSARKRLMKFEEQFPEAIDLLARALRAGHALTTGLQMVGEEVPEPVGGEFSRLFEHQNYGMSLADALRAFADRVPVLDARFFVTALLTQRETGGNLSEVLDNLATVIRERFRVKRQVRVISAHGRITGFTLGFLPPVVAGILFIISPMHMRLLIDDPLGVDMVIGAIVLQVVGVLIIRKIVDVEY